MAKETRLGNPRKINCGGKWVCPKEGWDIKVEVRLVESFYKIDNAQRATQEQGWSVWLVGGESVVEAIMHHSASCIQRTSPT